ncbi:MAG TPA: Eco57I restriction-modification methylase domain-containing protein, partial [Candidatus Paceibacterota bacterium]|nr:Eco57I restriction-modification methylase domain-containing protein [Candidatus Paceibacterota bacterium]
EEKKGIIERVYNELEKKGKQFVIWEIDFADVFEEKGGFDVVIGNPPYIRQEKISPPFIPQKDVNLKEKTKYKNELIESIKIKYPFIKEFNRKCDYYIYFYFHGLNLLNPKGTFCFITSNSWLDVGYGKALQEYLAKFVPIKAIYDNQVKRSFEHASINTIIVFFGAPLIKNSKNPNPTCLDNVAKFIMLKKPCEEVISTQNLIAIDNFIPVSQSLFGNTLKTDQFRVYAIKQEDLLKEGLESKKEEDNKMFKENFSGEYLGSKWGGKYLRAPDIYFTILKKGKDKLVKLGDIAEVSRGFTTGANEFFYVEDVTDKINFLQVKSKIKNFGDFSNIEEIKKAKLRIIYNKEDNSSWLIEEEFLKPVIKSPRECKSIIVKMEDLKYKVFMCHKSKTELKGTKAIEYITWGEKQKYNKRPTCASRKYWWNLGKINISDMFCMMSMNDRHIWWLNKKSLVDARLYDIYLKDKENIDSVIFSLNSSLTPLFVELNARANLGEGALDFKVYEANEILVLILKEFKINNDINYLLCREIKSIFQELDFDPTKPIREQQPNPLPDRKALDDLFFDALGLTEEEKKEVYWATAELVKNRLDKARSVKKK